MKRREFLGLLGSTAAGLAFGHGPVGADSQRAGGGRGPLKIGIIGSGRMGGTLGELWAKAGHEIFFSSRHPDQLAPLVERVGRGARAGLPREAAAFGDVVLVSVPYAALPEIGREYAAELKGKIVLDTCNPVERRDGPMAAEALAKGAGLASAELLPGTRLVRAFNAINFRALASEAHRPGDRVAIPIAGDDAEALAVASRLVEDAGFDPVIVGGLATAKQFQPGTPVYVKLLTARELRQALGLAERQREIREGYAKAYGARPGLGVDFSGWKDEGAWPER